MQPRAYHSYDVPYVVVVVVVVRPSLSKMTMSMISHRAATVCPKVADEANLGKAAFPTSRAVVDWC